MSTTERAYQQYVGDSAHIAFEGQLEISEMPFDLPRPSGCQVIAQKP